MDANNDLADMRRYADFQKFNFFCRPDWRWERVVRLVDRHTSPGRCTRRDDAYIRAARKFALCWRNRDSIEQREELFWETPGLYYAHDLHMRAANGEEDREGALFIQARLLARQDYATIAKAMGITPETVEWYEAIFFNVRNKLEHRDWVTKHIILPGMLRSPSSIDASGDTVPFRDSSVAKPFLDGSLKLFAYFGGPHLVDILINGLQAGKPLISVDDMPAWVDQAWSMTVRRRSMMAATQFEINKYNVMELFAVHTRIMELERSEDTADKTRSATERHIEAMIASIPFCAGGTGERILANSALGRHDAEALELRDEEVQRVAAGQGIDLAGWPKALPAPIPKETTQTKEDIEL